MCEVGVVIFFDCSHYLILKYVVGQGRNNQVVFYAFVAVVENNNGKTIKALVGF